MNRSGELFILGESLLWSLFPIFTILTITSLTPLYAASITTFVAAVFFAVVVSFQRNWGQLLIIKAWKYILGSTALIGILFYALVYIGISFTSAGNASIALLMEVFFSFVILHFWKKERATIRNIFGAFFMVLGAIIVFLPSTGAFRVGDIILILAAIIPPIGNYFQQKARQLVSSSVLLFVRSLISSLFLFGIAINISDLPTLPMLISVLPYILISGILFLGLSKIFWIEAIHRIPITKAISIANITPVFTLLFAYLILGDAPLLFQMIGIVPMIIGAQLLLK